MRRFSPILFLGLATCAQPEAAPTPLDIDVSAGLELTPFDVNQGATPSMRELVRAQGNGPGPFAVADTEPAHELTRPSCSRAGADRSQVEQYDRMTLRRVGGDDVIRVHAVPVHLQWRNLLAGQTDVAPALPAMYRSWFDGMEDMRVVDLEESGPLALVFNTETGPFADVDRRRALARLLDMDALALAACRHDQCRALGTWQIDPWRDIPAPSAGIDLPDDLEILALDSDWNGAQAAEAISYQVRRARPGTRVRVERCPIGALLTAVAPRDFDLMVVPLRLPVAGEVDTFHRSMGPSGYWSAPLEDAVRTGQLEAVAAIMRDQVFVLPLFRYAYFAAIDARLCGGEPRVPTSWDWLADLHPCAPGERP